VPDVPAVEATVADLGRAFVEHCGAASAQTILDPPDQQAFGGLLADVAERAEDLLLFYYVGHGLVSPAGELYLATQATDDLSDGLGYKALAYSEVRSTLLQCRARSIVVVLDCCFSGRADGSLGTPIADAFGSTYIRGSYLLASAADDEEALAPPGERHTAFSGELLRLLSEGEATGPPRLTLDYVYDHLYRALPQQGFPRPHRQAGGQGGRLILAANPAHRPPPPGTPSDQAEADDGECPYQGLAAFSDADAAYFFGRERLTSELCDGLAGRLAGGGPLAVLGPSGSGKSSLVQAGLLPALRRGELRVPGSHSWPPLIMTPGEHPMLALATALHGSLEEPGDVLQTVRRVLRAQAGVRLVLVVDQFEEVFTACQDAVERRLFIQCLRAVAGPYDDDREPVALVVLAVRSDFYEHCLSHPELASALRDHPVLVGPMSDDEFRAAIEKPAQVAGLALQEHLVDRLLHDLHVGSPAGGGLPLLSYALRETWLHREGRLLTLAGYETTGGIWQTVARRAEAIYAGLDRQFGLAGQQAVRVLMLHLVRVGDSGEDPRRRVGDSSEDTRRRIDLTELLADRLAEEASAITAARDAFADPMARLITLSEGKAELTHEALVRAWPRLRRWIDQDRDDLLAAQRVADDARAWQEGGQDTGRLYRGARLELAVELLRGERVPGHLSALDRKFLAAGAIAARRRRLLRAGSLAVVVIVVMAALGGGVSLVSAQRQLERRTLLADARELLRSADARRESQPFNAVGWGVAAYGAAQRSGDAQLVRDARTGLVATLAQSRLFGNIAAGSDTIGFDVGPDHWLTTLNGQGKATLWDLAQGPPGRAVPLGTEARVDQGTFTPKTGLFVSVTADHYLTVWSLARRTKPQRLGAARTGPARITAIVADSDGRRLLTGDEDGGLKVWSVADPTCPRLLGAGAPNSRNSVQDLVLKPDGKTAVSVTRDTATTWRLTDPRHPRPVTSTPLPGLYEANPHALSVDRRSIVQAPSGIITKISPDGTTIAVGGSTNGAAAALLTDARAQGPRVLATFPGHALTITDMAFAHSGRLLATAGADRRIQLWDISDRRRPKLLNVLHDDEFDTGGLLFGPQDDALVSLRSDGSMSLWNIHMLVHQTSATTLPPSSRYVYLRPKPNGQVREVESKSRAARGPVAAGDQASPLLVTGTSARERATLGKGGYVPGDNSDATFTIWDTASGKLTRRATRGGQHSITALALAPGRKLLAVGTGLGDLGLWNLAHPADPQILAHLSPQDMAMVHPVEIGRLAFSADQRTLAVGTAGGGVILVGLEQADHPVIHARLTEFGGSVHALRFVPDDTTLLTGSGDGFLRIWDLRRATDPRLISTLPVFDSALLSVAYSPITHLLATGAVGKTGTVTLWDLSTSQSPVRLETVDGPGIGTLTLEFDPSGTYLVATDEGRHLIQWSVRGAADLIRDPLSFACRLVENGLPTKELAPQSAIWSQIGPVCGRS
jgi:WD40 repeat protein